ETLIEEGDASANEIPEAEAMTLSDIPTPTLPPVTSIAADPEPVQVVTPPEVQVLSAPSIKHTVIGEEETVEKEQELEKPAVTRVELDSLYCKHIVTFEESYDLAEVCNLAHVSTTDCPLSENSTFCTPAGTPSFSRPSQVQSKPMTPESPCFHPGPVVPPVS